MDKTWALGVIREYERKFSDPDLQLKLTIQEFSEYNDAKYVLSVLGLEEQPGQTNGTTDKSNSGRCR